MSDLETFHAFMPITKNVNGGFVGVLSDTSLDRDEEFMTKELLETWASDNTPLPMLANHENKIEKLIGGWTNRKTVSKGENTVLVAEPFFLKTNPLGVQVERMIEEALEKGLNPGISIGAIPKETIEKTVNGMKKRGFSKAEIVEATVVPIQSNRNATFQSIAKSFDLVFEKKQSEIIENKIDSEVQKMTENIEVPKVEVQDMKKLLELETKKCTDEVSVLRKEIVELKELLKKQPVMDKPSEQAEVYSIEKALSLMRGGK